MFIKGSIVYEKVILHMQEYFLKICIIVVVAIEWENKTSSRVVSVALGPGTFIKILSKRNEMLRMINTEHLKWLTVVKQNDKQQNTLSIRVHREYDLVSQSRFLVQRNV